MIQISQMKLPVKHTEEELKKAIAKVLKSIEDFTQKYDIIVGIHDIMVHDYGPGRKIVSFHAEIPANSDICMAHDIIDQMEQDIYDEFN